MIGLLDRVQAIVGSFDHGPEERPDYMIEVYGLFERCSSQLRAIRLLVANGLAHEAAQLLRSLFTDTLVLSEFATRDANARLELVIGRELDALSDLDGLMREAQRRGDEVDQQLEGIANRRDHLRSLAEKKGLRGRPWKADEKKLAEAHGRDGYLDFRLGSHAVHGSSFALVLRRARLDDEHGTTAIGGPDAQWDEFGPVVELSAAEFMLEACRALAMTLERPEPEGLHQLISEIQATGARLSSG